MAIKFRERNEATRRQFLKTLAVTGSLAGTGIIAKPYLSRAADRPKLTGGLQSGDVSLNSAVVWARTDRPARMHAEFSTVESMKTIFRTETIDALPDSDFTAKLLVDHLPIGQDIFYRIRFDNLSDPSISGEQQIGHFRTPPRDQSSISFVWSGDTAGQGWGIDPSLGGMKTYKTMLEDRPDFFIHSGDNIYADCPIPNLLELPNGAVWRNLVTEEKSVVAQTLTEFRGNYKYNLLDENVRAFNAQIPIFAQWDDHEVTNDWSPSCPGDDASSIAAMSQLVARARQAFHEFMPIRPIAEEAGRIYRKISYGPLLDVFLIDMRSYRDSLCNKGDKRANAFILGATQVAWLKRQLAKSTTTWKVIAADLPIGIVSSDAVAMGDGPPEGRECEIADLLSFMKRAEIANVVWLTADAHYTAAHYYDPNQAQFQDFDPFWEFVSGPLHAGTWPPGQLDNTFGPKAIFQKGCSPEQGENLAPCFGLQFYGHVNIDGESQVMTVTLKDSAGQSLWFVPIHPMRNTRSSRGS